MSDNEIQFLIALGAQIKAARKVKGIKQAQLAAICDFEKASMSRIESGKSNVTALTLHKICTNLEMPVTDIFRHIGQ